MKLAILAILAIMLFTSCSRKTLSSRSKQTTQLIYDTNGNIISGRLDSLPRTSVRLKDKLLNYTFILDSSHIYVSAYDSIGNLVWKLDPYLGNITSYDRASRTITNIYFKDITYRGSTKPDKALLVRYGNRVSGYLDLKTGEFHLSTI
jgi:hypothetical protein